jgi:hypothetical protein
MELTLWEGAQIAQHRGFMGWVQWIQLWNEHGQNVMTAIRQIAAWNDERAEEYIEWLENSGEMDRMAEQGRTQQALEQSRRQQGAFPELATTQGGAITQSSTATTETSLSNQPTTTQMAKRQKTGENDGMTHEGGSETDPSPIGHIWTHFPNSQTARLTWIDGYFFANTLFGTQQQPFQEVGLQAASSLSTTAGGAITQSSTNYLEQNLTALAYDFSLPYLIQLRMTSPYNIMKSIGTLNTTTQFNQPNWLSLFDNKYQYYKVLDTEWHIDFNFGVPLHSSNTAAPAFQEYALYIFWRYTNEDDPPTTWTTILNNTLVRQTIATSNDPVVGTGSTAADTITAVNNITDATQRSLTSSDYHRMKGWHSKRITFNTITATTAHISGKYKFGQCKMDIKTLSSDTHSLGITAEEWSQCGATLAFPENLSVIIVEDDMTTNNSGQVQVATSCRFHTEQTIQFKDLRPNFKFPTPALANAQGATTLFNEEIYFSRGALY